MCYYLNSVFSLLLKSSDLLSSLSVTACRCDLCCMYICTFMHVRVSVCTLDVCLIHTCTVIYTLWYIDTLLWTRQSFTDLVLSTLRVFNLVGIKGHLNISGFFPMYIVFVKSNPFSPVKLLVNVKMMVGRKKNTQMPVQCLLIICPFVLFCQC